MPLRRPPATRLRSTSRPTRSRTDSAQLTAFAKRAAFGPPFCLMARIARGEARNRRLRDCRSAGSAAALPGRGIVGRADSGRSMAEAADDLSTPLGQKTVRRKRRFRLPFTGIQALAVVLGLFLVVFVGFALFNDNPFGGEPIARVALRQPAPAGDKSAAAASSAAEPAMKSAPKQAPAGEQKTVTIIDGSSGARHDVVIGGAADKAEPDAAPAMVAGIDQR